MVTSIEPISQAVCTRKMYRLRLRRYKTRLFLTVSAIFVWICFALTVNWSNSIQVNSLNINHSAFKEDIMNTASPHGDVILSLVDESYLDMTINFHLLSIQPNNITNILYVSLSQRVCTTLKERFPWLRCHVLQNVNATKEDKDDVPHLGQLDAEYGSMHFKKKMIVRTWVVLEALSTGKNILVTDVDMVYFKNPLPYFKCRNCDLEVMDDCAQIDGKQIFCGGFIYIRPTPRSKKVFVHILNRQIRTNMDDQELLNQVIHRDMKKEIKVRILDKQKFLCGWQYYEKDNRYFADNQTCKHCVVAHNNWIVSKPAKVYRFKELHQWVYDDNGYYSNPNTKYIIYQNRKPSARVHNISKSQTIEKEKMDNSKVGYQTQALATALEIALILNRTLILPKFHCQSNECPFNALYHVPTFHAAFNKRYRESSFLSHKYVPKDIKEDISVPFRISTDDAQCTKMDYATNQNALVLTPEDSVKGIAARQILEWFSGVKNSVLNLDVLCGVHFSSSSTDDLKFKRRLSKSIVRSTYRQYQITDSSLGFYLPILLLGLSSVLLVFSCMRVFALKKKHVVTR